MVQTYKLSKEGHEKLLAEYDELKQVKRKAAVDRLARARSMGDLSENSEYSAAKEDLAFVDGRIAEIDEILKSVEIIHEGSDSDHVQLGDTVTLKNGKAEEKYTIVGALEADITQQKISDSSPLGKALIGAKIGTSISVNAPAGKIEYNVIKIS